MSNRSSMPSIRLAFGLFSGAATCRLPCTSALPPTNHHRQRVGRMDVAVTHAAAVDDHRVVEQRAVAVRRRGQPLHELREQRHVVGVHARVRGDAVGVVGVVRQHVVRQRRVDVRVGPLAQLARHHEREHAREVDLVGQRQQVVEHADVFLVRFRHADRRVGHLDRRLRLGLGALDAPLHFTHVVQILAETLPIARADALLEGGHVLGDEIEHAAVLAHPGAALVGGRAAAEHPLEQHAGVDFHRQRRGRALPAERVGVGAAEAGRARAEQRREVLGRHFERRERGVLADLGRNHLVHGDAEPEVGTVGALGRHTGEPRRRRTGVVGVGPDLGPRQVADDEHPLFVRGKRHQDRLQFERAEGRRHPLIHDHAVRHVDGPEPVLGPGRGLGRRGQRRHHRVEQRQPQGHTHAPQEGSPRQRCFGDEHQRCSSEAAGARERARASWPVVPPVRMRNGVLLTTPRTMAENRSPFCAASRAIARTTGRSW